MKNKILTALLLFSAFSGYSQHVFIGKSISDVKDAYYSVPKESFFQGKNKETKEAYLVIKVRGVDKFSGTFDKSGKCYQHTTEIAEKDINPATANLKKMGYTYDEKEKTWYNFAKTISFQVEKQADHFYLVCKKVNK